MYTAIAHHFKMSSPTSSSSSYTSLAFKAAVGFGAVLAVSLFTARLVTKSRKKKKITRIIDTIDEFHKSTVRIKDPDRVEEIVCQLIKSGASKLQVVSDFDATLTRAHFHGIRCKTTYGILDDSPLITEDHRQQARLLFEKYYPIEIDPHLTIEEKIPYMVDWYTKSHNLLINGGIKKADINKMVQASNVMLRDGCDVLFETLQDHNIPLLIFSAGVGDIVEEVLRHYKVLYPNMKFISNYMQFNDKGNVVGFKGDLIHVYNKNQTSIHNSEYFQKLEGRTNILLMGDSIGDLDMAHGITESETVLRIGFLNDKIDENLPAYLKGYDIVLVDDQTMDLVNGLLRRIL